MKTALFVGLAALAVASLCSCNDKSLAAKTDGTWEAATKTMTCPRHDDDHDMASDAAHRAECPSELTCTPTVTFTRNSGTNGGSVDFEGKYTISRDFTTSDSLQLRATVSGTAKASGAYTVVDDDDIRLDLQPATTQISVDPSSLTITFARLTARPTEELDTIRSLIAPQMESYARTVLQRRIASLDKMDDVKMLTDSTFKAEVHDVDFIFAKK